MSEHQRPTRAVVSDVCVLHEIRPGWYHDTAIDKRPVEGPVLVTASGLTGDRQLDSGHGGADAAVYVYASEDAEHFATALGRELPAGTFGENLRTTGLDVTGARLGERWRIGELVLEVRKPRTPCPNLSQRVGVDRFHVEFNRTGRVGAMCKVVTPGEVSAGDELSIDLVPDHETTIGAFVTGMSADSARALLDSGLTLPRPVAAKARRTLRKA